MKCFLQLCCFMLLSCNVLAQSVYDPSVEVPGYDADKAAGAFSTRSKKALPLPAGKSGIKNAPSQNCYISPDGSYTAVPRNDDGFYGPIALGFDLQVYDQTYNEIYINTNGTVTFGNGSTDFNHTSSFPTCDKLTMAPFWSDVDTRQPGSGQIWYKSTGTHFIVTWDKVGYYNGHHDLKNSFQVVLTNGTDPLLGNGNNIGYFYGDMQWTTGDASGGTAGFKGDAALVGMSQYCPALTRQSTNYIYEVFGYFSQDNNAFYDANDRNNGVHYLDNRCVLYSTISNLAPEVSGVPDGDEITMEIGEEKELEIKFTGPETDQHITATVNTSGRCNIEQTITNGTTASVKLKIKADTCNIGDGYIELRAEDDHNNPQVTYAYLRIRVKKLNQAITFPPVATQVNGSVVYLRATSGSGLPVSYRVVSGPGSLGGSVLNINGVGTTIIEASQEGNAQYDAAPPQTISFCAIPAALAWVDDPKDRVCVNVENNYHIRYQRGDVQYFWKSDESAEITPNGSGAKVLWRTPGMHTLSVKAAGNCGDTTTVLSMDVFADGQAPSGAFERMLPSDGSESNALPVKFTWFPVEGASYYQLYIWPAAAPRPASPHTTTGNLQYILNSLPVSIEYGKPVKWQIVAGNGCGQLESHVQTFTMRELPDLIIQNVQVPPGGFSGRPVTVSWEVKNTGAGSTLEQDWGEHIYLSKDVFLDDGDIMAGTLTNQGSLHTGEAYTASYTFPLPQGMEGAYYAIIKLSPRTLLQSNTGNDEAHSIEQTTVQLTPSPDLEVTAMVTPNVVFSGQPVNVEWVITNKGAGTTTRPDWRDGLYLSQQPEFDGSAILVDNFNHYRIIPVNGTDTARTRITLPENIHGTWYFHVVADKNNYIYEHAAENNNHRRSEAIEVVLTPPVDLVVASITIPPAAANRELIKVTWTVENAGGSATRNGWMDHVYLSPEKVLDTNTAILLGRFKNVNALNTGAQYVAGADLRIPQGITGPYYLHVLADATGKIFEYTYEQNNATASEQALRIHTPDLTVSNVSAPVTAATTGDKLNISWTVKNTGTGNLPDTIMKDRILLSKRSTPAEQDLIPLRVVEYNTGELTSGMPLVKQAEIKLPYDLSGDYYLFVQTNHTGLVYETSSTNNSGHSSTVISITPGTWPDLQVATVTTGSNTAKAGEELPFAFRVENRGHRVVEDSAWADRVYISSITPFDSTKSILLRELEQQRLLQPQQGYDVSGALYLPNNLQAGNYYLYVLTDAKGNIGEQTDEGNNTSTGSQVQVTAYPPVDLAVSKVTGPAGSRSGAAVKVSWTVTNNGEAATIASQWTDALYISTDLNWDNEDQLIRSFRHNGVLAAGAQYTDEQTVEIPNGIAGNYYLLMVTDTGRIQLDINRSNNSLTILSANGTPVPVEVEPTPPPDLVISNYTVPDEGTAGQPLLIKWTVQNTGTGVTIPGSWTDRIYLSTDVELDNHDIVLGTKPVSKTLQPGETYKDSIRLILPVETSGNYVVIIKTDAINEVYEQHNNNNIAKAYTGISTAPASDLIVSGIDVPLTAMAGDEVTIKWKLKNIGANRAYGTLRNAVYLSTDQQKDLQDILLGIPEMHVSIEPNMEVTLSLKAKLSDVALKDYHVIIHTNLLRNISESDETNNILASAEKLNIQVPELLLENTTIKTLADKAVTYYRISIPDSLAGESLLITLKSQTINAANEIYLRYTEAPGRITYDHAGNQPYTGNQEIVVPELKAGTYYLMVTGSATPAATQQLDVFAGILRFGIRKADADKGGNTGTVTIAIHGSKFGNVTELKLEAQGRVVTAKNISMVNAAKMFAVFDLSGTTPGVYDLVAQNAKGESASLHEGFTIEQGGSGTLQTSISVPPSTRPSNVVGIVINFTNAGNTDIIHPQLKLLSVAGAPLAFTLADLTKNEHELTFKVQELNGPPGILRPGAGGTITIYTKAVSTLGFILTDATNK